MLRKTNIWLEIRWITLMLLLSSLPFYIVAQVPVTVSDQITEYQGKSYYLHQVEAQQTLYGISKAYGVTVESLLLANPDARRGIRINQVIRVPAGRSFQPESMTAAAPPTPANASDEYEYVYHVAGKNETFAYLSNIYLVAEQSIRTANPSRKEPFREGDYVLIPVSKKEKQTQTAIQSRSSLDPFNTPSQPKDQHTQQTRMQLADASIKETQTVLPFEIPQEAQAATTTKTTNKPVAAVVTEKEPVPTNHMGQHIVKPKETLYSIARQYHISQADLIAANPGIQANIQAGQVIRLPATPIKTETVSETPLIPDDSSFYHTVQKGQTLYSISRSYAVSIDELKQLNPGLTEHIKTGQKILIPKKKITLDYFIHTIDKEQRSRQLARNFELSWNEFTTYNPGVGRYVFPHQQVKIPVPEHLLLQPVFPEEPVHTPLIDTFPQQKTIQELQLPDTPETDCRQEEYFRQQSYRIALMLPLYLETYSQEAVKKSPTDKPQASPFLQFYHGFIMAADSLSTHFGLQLEIVVYDIDQDPQKLRDALSDPRLQSVQLIVGPFFGQAFDQVAHFAKQHQIPIVNPMSQRSEFTYDNPYAIKVKPDMQSMFGEVAQILCSTYPQAQFFLYQANKYRDQKELEALKTALEQRIEPQVHISNRSLYSFYRLHRRGRSNNGPSIRSEGGWINVNELELTPDSYTNFDNQLITLSYDQDDIHSFGRLASAVRDNIVVVYSEDRVFAMEFINKLNQIADTISVQVVALPDWSRFDNLFIENLMRLQAHFISPSFIDYEAMETQFFIHNFRLKHQTDPDSYAFEGFDLGWYFLSALQQFGPDFYRCLHHYPLQLLQTSYLFPPPENNKGAENILWNIYKYHNYFLKPVIR